MELLEAGISDTALLSDIALKSKRYWGYTDEQMDLWKSDFDFPQEYTTNNCVYKAVVEGRVIGFFCINLKDQELDEMFILPEFIGKGFGRKMFEKIEDIMKIQGISCLKIVSDPNASSFYQKMGAIVIDKTESAISGRYLPVLKFERK